MNLSRRGFLRSGVAAGTGLLSTRAGAKVRSNEPVDALVIGSGFGGAIAALRLAHAGINAVVLERGKRWPITPAQDTFCTFQKPDGRSSWLSNIATALDPVPIDVFTGVLELINANGMILRNGAGVGGGSLVYNAIMLEPTRKLFRQVFPRAIDYDELVQIYFPRVRSVLKCSTIPKNILDTQYYKSSIVNLEQALNAGYNTTHLVEYNVNWHIVRDEIKGKLNPAAIDGQSWFGINSGAKNSVDRNYLAMAEATRKVEVLPLHVVTDIAEDRNEKTYTVTANRIDTNGVVQSTVEFTTRRLFLAAGSYGTSSLLVKAREKKTLPRMTPQAGQGWGNNGDFIAFRGGLGNNNAGQGGPSGHFLMEDEDNPFMPTNMVELVVPKSDAFPGASLYVGLGLAPPVGYFTYDPATDSTTLNWPGSDDPRLTNWANGAKSLVDRLNAANPGSFNAFYGDNLSAHPVGGANAGVVCDLFGRVKGHPGLYVVDGAFIPGGSTGGVNPSFTIAALAERSMEAIIAYDFH